MVDASAYRTYVAIAFRNQSVDVTASVISWDAGGEINNGAGKLQFSGELVLGDGPDLPSICNPRNNPTMLYRGAAVIVECDRVDGAGRVRHPRGLLYVLSEPNEPTPDNPEIKFELGCSLTRDGEEDEPAPSLSGATEGEEIDKPNTPSKFERAANRLQYYYQTNQGGLAIGSSRLNRLPTRTFYLGQDEVEYRTGGVTGGGSGEEFDALRVVGVGKKEISNYSTTVTVTTETGIAAMINPAYGSSEIVTRRVTATETVTATERKRTEVVEMVAALAAPVSYKDSLSLIPVETSTTSSVYEASGERRLIRTTSKKEGLLEAVLKSYFDNQFTENMKNAGLGREMITAETSETEYEYAPDNTVRATVTSTFQPLGAIVSDEGTLEDGGSTDAIAYLEMVPAAWNRTEYLQLADGAWKRTSASRAPAVSVRDIDLDSNPNVIYQGAQSRAEIKAQLVYSESTVEVSNAGQTAPPAAERGTEPFRYEEFPIVVSVFIPSAAALPSAALPAGFEGTLPPAGSRKPRYRDIQVEELEDAKQAIAIAQTQMARSQARLRTVEFQLPFDDQILTLTDPQPCWKFVYPDGSADIVLVEGLQFSHDAEQAVCAASGIRLAMQLPGSNALLTPYPEIAIEIESATGTEDGSFDDPEIVVFPPPIIHRTSVLGYGFRSATEYTIKPHRPALLSGVEMVLEVENTIPVTTLPTITSVRGFGAAPTLRAEILGIGAVFGAPLPPTSSFVKVPKKGSEYGYALGLMAIAPALTAAFTSESGIGIRNRSEAARHSTRGYGAAQVNRDGADPIYSTRGFAAGRFVRPPLQKTLIQSTVGYSTGRVGRDGADPVSSAKGFATGRRTTITTVRSSTRGFATGRTLT